MACFNVPVLSKEWFQVTVGCSSRLSHYRIVLHELAHHLVSDHHNVERSIEAGRGMYFAEAIEKQAARILSN